MNVTTTGSRNLIENVFLLKNVFIAGANYERKKNRGDLVEM